MATTLTDRDTASDPGGDSLGMESSGVKKKDNRPERRTAPPGINPPWTFGHEWQLPGTAGKETYGSAKGRS